MSSAVFRQIELLLKQLGWNWSSPRVAAWLNRAGFSSPQQLTPKAQIALAQFLSEVFEVSALQAQRGLDGTYAVQWFVARGYTDGLAPLKGWIALREHLEAMEKDIPF